MADRLGRRNERRDGDTLESLVETAVSARSVTEAATVLGATPGLDVVVVDDERSRPVGLVAATGPEELTSVLTVKADETIVGVAKRCLTRPHPLWWHPPVCVDELGQYVGMVRAEQIVHHLLARSEGNQR